MSDNTTAVLFALIGAGTLCFLAWTVKGCDIERGKKYIEEGRIRAAVEANR